MKLKRMDKCVLHVYSLDYHYIYKDASCSSCWMSSTLIPFLSQLLSIYTVYNIRRKRRKDMKKYLEKLFEKFKISL